MRVFIIEKPSKIWYIIYTMDRTLNSTQDITFFAETNYRNQRRKFGIRTDDRRRHMYIVGKTGMGKTTLLENMVIQDIRNGHGLAYVDPHGDTADRILDFIPSNRINDVVYFDPSDLDFPFAFNILESVANEQKHLVASGLMGVFTKIWANLWSARMEYILNNTVLALLEVPGNTLLGITRMLVDKTFRKKIVSRVKDPIVKSFWTEEFANYNDRFRTEAIAPIQNKVGQFLSSSIIRNIVGQPKSTIDLRDIMDNGKILILNLSKGKIGEDASALLGAMMITKIQLAAMSRVDIPESQRRDFFLYVDEFQNFSTESFAHILSEARKYRLNLILAHQYMAQLSDEVRGAVFGNVGTIMSFRVGAEDAEELEKEFKPYIQSVDLVNLGKIQICLKLMIDGVASKPFTAQTLPPISEGSNYAENRQKILRVSRERYARPREDVEYKIIKWLKPDSLAKSTAGNMGIPEDEEAFEHEETKNKKSEKELFDVVCDNCKNALQVSFVPDKNRNVFCKDCLKKFKAGEIDSSKLEKLNIKKDSSDESTDRNAKSKDGKQVESSYENLPDVVNEYDEKTDKESADVAIPPAKSSISEIIPKDVEMKQSEDVSVESKDDVNVESDFEETSLESLVKQKPVKFRDVDNKKQVNKTDNHNSVEHEVREGEVVRFDV